MEATAKPRRDTFNIIFFGALGVFLCTHWIFLPMPDRSTLTEHNGTLESYSVEKSDTASRRNANYYVFFRVSGDGRRFWTEALKPEAAGDAFSRKGATVRFYIDENDNHRLMNGARKSYGLIVDGRVIQKMSAAVDNDRAIGLFVLPMMGLGFLGYAIYQWHFSTAEKS